MAAVVLAGRAGVLTHFPRVHRAEDAAGWVNVDHLSCLPFGFAFSGRSPFSFLRGSGEVFSIFLTVFRKAGSSSGLSSFLGLSDMAEDDIDPVTVEHLKGFGAITHLFARSENLMYIAAAGILDVDMGTAIILLGDGSYSQTRQTLRHLNTTIGVEGQRSPEIQAYLDAAHKKSKLRNWVAHSTWVAGRRPGSIKPMQLILRSDEPKPLGHWHNEKDYTAEELWVHGADLHRLNYNFNVYLARTGLLQRVAAKSESTNSPTASSPG